MPEIKLKKITVKRLRQAIKAMNKNRAVAADGWSVKEFAAMPDAIMITFIMAIIVIVLILLMMVTHRRSVHRLCHHPSYLIMGSHLALLQILEKR